MFFISLSLEIVLMSILLTWVFPLIPWFPGAITYGTLLLNHIRIYFRKD